MISQLWPALSILRMYRSSTDPGAYRLLSNGITIISNPRLSTPALHLLHPGHLSIASLSMTISILINSWRGSSWFFSAYSILKNSILNISYATPVTSTPTPIQFVQCRLLVGSLLMKYLLLRFHSTFLDIISEKWCGDISDIRCLWLRAFIGQSGSENGGRESIRRVIAFCLLEFPIHMPRYSWIYTQVKWLHYVLIHSTLCLEFQFCMKLWHHVRLRLLRFVHRPIDCWQSLGMGSPANSKGDSELRAEPEVASISSIPPHCYSSSSTQFNSFHRSTQSIDHRFLTLAWRSWWLGGFGGWLVLNDWLGLHVHLALLFCRSSNSSPCIILDVILFRFDLRVSVLRPSSSGNQYISNPDLVQAITPLISVMNSG